MPDLPVVDTPPRNGKWAEEHPAPTLEEIAAGNLLGRVIDVDDDTDNGLPRSRLPDVDEPRHTCPRRAEGGPLSAGEGTDSYEPGHGIIGQVRGCSYCGSMAPDDFMAALRAGIEIGPTDKSYKFYVGRGAATKWFGTNGGKFYTQHLTGDQGDEFAALWLADKINWGYPGHPYVQLYIPGQGGGS